MIIQDFTSEPFTASINNAPPKTIKQRLTTYKVSNDEDMIALAGAMAQGRNIVLQLEGQDCAYIMVREFIPVKIAMSNPERKIIEQ